VADHLSIRAFARADGCSEGLVRRGIKEGRLSLGDDGKLDAKLAGTAWRQGNIASAEAVRTPTAKKRANTGVRSAGVRTKPSGDRNTRSAAKASDKRAGRAESGNSGYSASMAKKEHFLALKHEMEYRKKSGELIELELARRVVFAEFRAYRDALLNFPSRYAPLVAADLGVDADRVAEVLTGYVHKLLASLAEPSGRFEG